MADVDNDHIATYIKDSVRVIFDDLDTHMKDSLREVFNDNSIETQSASDEKLQGLLRILCIRDESGNDILSANLEKLQSNLNEIQQLLWNDQKLSEFIRSNRSWLAPPPPGMVEVDALSNSVRLHGHRVNAPGKPWPPQTHVWKLLVPIDKSTGRPLILNLPDPTIDDAGNDLKSVRSILGAYVNVKMKITDSKETHEAEVDIPKSNNVCAKAIEDAEKPTEATPPVEPAPSIPTG